MCERDGSPLEQVEQVLAGRYVLKSVIGSGNMGTVYRATQLPMGRDVAVKLMHSDLVRNPDLVERFEREAQAAATVDHPNAITVFDSGRTSDGQVYISMELLEGESLSAMIDREIQIPPERALELWIPVVKAMVVAHRKGVIHRDLKPWNFPLLNLPKFLRGEFRGKAAQLIPNFFGSVNKKSSTELLSVGSKSVTSIAILRSPSII